MKIIFATGNKHKIEEIKEILGDEIDIICASDVGADIDVEEDGKTFKDNAMIKAMHVWKQIGGLVAADDSGLSIDALGGEPGILSARYMGKDTPYDKKCDMILSRMKDVKDDDRSARFTCAIAVILPDGTSFECEGVMEGMIASMPAGSHGFGYDPIFYIPSKHMTAAQLSPDDKNAISHRGKAIRAMRDRLADYEGL